MQSWRTSKRHVEAPWENGNPADCNSVYAGSSPAGASSFHRLTNGRVAERLKAAAC
jgi:hypothetical protein